MHVPELNHITWCSFDAAPYEMHALCVACYAYSFLLYDELISDHKLSTNHELCDTGTLGHLPIYI